ncbi:hypothetical protein chiPu_0032198, partial [Chiloscyllium punctatum]|nr:hypothetical protein [Chiloscyllium punctatum]
MHERERRVVADRADVAEMVGQPLELGHQRAQQHRARRHRNLLRGLDGLRERQCIGNRAVAGHPAGQPRGLLDGASRHQPFDPLMGVAEPLLEANHGLAAGGEAEMSGFDDAGMHGADRNLVQAVTFGRKERIRRWIRCRIETLAQRCLHLPATMIEPGAAVRRRGGHESEQVVDGALRSKRRAMAG